MWRRNSPFFCCYDGNVKLYYAFHPICLTCPVRLCDVINALGHFAVILWIWNSALGSILHVPDLFIFHFPDKWVCPVLNTIYLWSSCPNDWWLLLQSIDRNAMTGRTLLLIKIKGQFRHLVRSTWSCSVMDLPPLCWSFYSDRLQNEHQTNSNDKVRCGRLLIHHLLWFP